MYIDWSQTLCCYFNLQLKEKLSWCLFIPLFGAYIISWFSATMNELFDLMTPYGVLCGALWQNLTETDKRVENMLLHSSADFYEIPLKSL